MSSPSEDTPYSIPLTLAEHLVSTPLLSWYDGVALQPNSLWGAQIYDNHNLILLGTFKSEISAARVYDSVARKIYGSDFFRNLFLTNLTIHEPSFQSMYTKEAIIDMIRDGSYEPKFMEFIWIHHPNFRYSGFVAWPTSLDTIHGVLFKEMFHKKLILTDMENKEVGARLPMRWSFVLMTLLSSIDLGTGEGVLPEFFMWLTSFGASFDKQ
ncbi:putative AP2/ERF and B3 domain-containing protein Os01g0140700 [Phalaenopsis equestris]|uniref:putative AP2/ERF and B3 domain-containing protein Os01g0140700 n=1 Tax=Phalaenopsis equestris TaxID=78828 RepID=UPI0009E28B0B|nr:putative AP2/ERF and B3 domain-containing protein Os01g0140700 [Phalaenopsis equestris]